MKSTKSKTKRTPQEIFRVQFGRDSDGWATSPASHPEVWLVRAASMSEAIGKVERKIAPQKPLCLVTEALGKLTIG